LTLKVGGNLCAQFILQIWRINATEDILNEKKYIEVLYGNIRKVLVHFQYFCTTEECQ